MQTGLTHVIWLKPSDFVQESSWTLLHTCICLNSASEFVHTCSRGNHYPSFFCSVYEIVASIFSRKPRQNLIIELDKIYPNCFCSRDNYYVTYTHGNAIRQKLSFFFLFIFLIEEKNQFQESLKRFYFVNVDSCVGLHLVDEQEPSQYRLYKFK